MSRRLLAFLAVIALPDFTRAQSSQNMPGMAMPGPAGPVHPAHGKPASAKRIAKPTPARASRRLAPNGSPAQSGASRPGMVMDHAHGDQPVKGQMGMDQMDMGGGSMPGMTMGGAPSPPAAPPSGTSLPAGNAAAPATPIDHYADRDFSSAEMAAARARMMHEQGGQAFHQILVNLAEVQVRDGRNGYRWDGEGWLGGDINRVVVKSEGSGSFGQGLDGAEIQALYSRAIGPYFDFQAGIRHDIAPTPTRTYATIGIEGLTPYMFQVEARGFVATTGQLLGRLEGWYDQRLTQRLVLQPRVELNLSAQNDEVTRTGAGLVDAEFGLRLRYEIAREFAPYVGISYQADAGHTADYARAYGRSPRTTSFVAGVRFWF